MNLFKTYLHYKISKLVRSHGLKKPMLDVGCGRGDVVQLLDIEGIDSSEEAVNICRKNGLKVSCKSIFANKKKYNSVICLDVIEHIKNDEAFLKSLKKSLNKNGRLLLLTPSGKMMNDDINYGHYRRYSKSSIVKKIQDCGFKVEHVEMFGYPILHYSRKALNVAMPPKIKSRNLEENTKTSAVETPFKNPFVNKFMDVLGKNKIFNKVLEKQDFFSKGEKGLAVIVVARKL